MKHPSPQTIIHPSFQQNYNLQTAITKIVDRPKYDLGINNINRHHKRQSRKEVGEEQGKEEKTHRTAFVACLIDEQIP